MDKVIDINKVKFEQLKDYYSKNGLTIVGLNDSQGVNTTTLFRKGLLEYLACLLTDENVDTKVINAFSLMFNKTEHIDYFLESNLSVEEIKNLQVNGMVSALEKAMQDFHLPKFLGKVGYVSKALYRKKDGDENTFLADTIREASEPIIIYSCGANDLMRAGWNNPFKIGKDYKNRDKNDNYKYTLAKFSDPKTVTRVIDSVENNFDNILSLNNKSDIYALGLYIPKSMQSEGMEIFNDAICQYNEYLFTLCKKYGMKYVDTEANGEKYNKGKVNFHVSTSGHYALAESIAEDIYVRKIKLNGMKNREEVQNEMKVYNNKTLDILVSLKRDLKKLEQELISLTGRDAEVCSKKISEVERQKNVVEKLVLKRM